MPEPRRPDDAEPIADAASVFDSGEVRTFNAPAASPEPKAEPKPRPAAEADPGDGYDLEVDPYAAPKGPASAPAPIPFDPDPLPTTGQRPGRRPEGTADPDPEPEPPPPPRAEVRTRPKAKPIPVPVEDFDEDDARPSTGGVGEEYEGEAAEVDPVWSRSLEWGPDLTRVGMAAGATLFLLWLTAWSFAGMSLAFLVGGGATVLLLYPILITLERPVRITPQHAVADFFAAASHHFPHYRRMWLLLSTAGRASGHFRTFDQFRSHWRGRIESWKQGRAGKYKPLHFEVVDFRAEKATGGTTTSVTYTVHIHVRGEDDSPPLASYKMAHGLVKGDDRMWYLNRGTLPSGRG